MIPYKTMSSAFRVLELRVHSTSLPENESREQIEKLGFKKNYSLDSELRRGSPSSTRPGLVMHGIAEAQRIPQSSDSKCRLPCCSSIGACRSFGSTRWATKPNHHQTPKKKPPALRRRVYGPRKLMESVLARKQARSTVFFSTGARLAWLRTCHSGFHKSVQTIVVAGTLHSTFSPGEPRRGRGTGAQLEKALAMCGLVLKQTPKQER